MALDISRVKLGRVDGNTNYATYRFPVASGITVTSGDFVYQDASGRITNATIAGARIVGFAEETATGNAGGTVLALVCIDPFMRYLLKVSGTFTAASVLRNFDLTGATGAQLVDGTSVGTNAQLLCLEYNPVIDPVATDTTYGVFVVAEHILHTGSGGQ